MPNLHPNSTSYVHSYEPNTNDLTMAMAYNNAGEPVIRARMEGVTINGPVTVDAVRIWDGSHYVALDIPNNDGEDPSDIYAISTENYNMVFNGSTWDRMRGNTTSGVLVQVSNFPSTQTVTVANGQIVVSNFTSTVHVDNFTSTVTVSNFPTSVTVTNFTSTVNINTMPSVTVSNFTSTVNVSSLPAISGTVTVTNFTSTVHVSNNVTATITSMPPFTGTATVYQGTTPWTIAGTVGIDQQDTFYGEPYSVPLNPVLQLNSYDGIRIRDTQTYTGGGGSVTPDESAILVSCTGTVGSYGVYRSRRFVPYNVGQSNIARILAKFDTPLAGTSQRIGIGNQENGYYIGYNGTQFGFLHNYGGRAEVWQLDLTNTASASQTITLVLNSTTYTITSIVKDDTAQTIAAKIVEYFKANVADTIWLPEQIDNTVVFLSGSVGDLTGTFSYASTGNTTGTITVKTQGVAATNTWHTVTLPDGVDPTHYNHWQFQYAWSGVNCYVLDVALGKFKLFYTFSGETGQEGQLPVSKPAFKITTVCYNIGGSTGVTLEVAGLFGAVEGDQNITKLTKGGGNTQSNLNGGTYWHIMSIQNPYVSVVDDYKLNYRSIQFLDLVASVQGNDPVIFYIYFDQPKVTGAHFDFVSVVQNIYQADMSDGVMDVSQDAPVASLVVGINGTQQFNLLDYNLVCPPGSHMSLVAYSSSSINKVTMSGTWRVVG